MSNPAARTLPYAPSVLAPMPKPEHRCPYPTCPRGGNLKPVLNCCIASPARCPNCSEDHAASYKDCTARAIPPPRTAHDATEAEEAAAPAPHRPPQPAPCPLTSTDPDAIDLQQDETGPPALSSTPPPQALCPPWSLLPQGPLFALHSWVPRHPPPGPVATNPMGSPAPLPPPETSQPRAGKCLTIHPLHLGAGPPHATCPSFSTTASGAGMCFFTCLILLLQLSAPLR